MVLKEIRFAYLGFTWSLSWWRKAFGRTSRTCLWGSRSRWRIFFLWKEKSLPFLFLFLGDVIPPDSTLLFDIVVVDVEQVLDEAEIEAEEERKREEQREIEREAELKRKQEERRKKEEEEEKRRLREEQVYFFD